jgi:hypothetical protein
MGSANLKSVIKALFIVCSVCLAAGALGICILGYFVHSHLLGRCNQAIQRSSGQGECRLGYTQSGVDVSVSGFSHTSGVSIRSAQITLSWSNVALLFRRPEQKFPFAEPLRAILAGSWNQSGNSSAAANEVKSVGRVVSFAGQIDLIGDGSDLRQSDIEIELSGLSEIRPESAQLRGSIVKTDVSAGEKETAYRLQCNACVFAWGSDRVDFGVETRALVAARHFEFPLGVSFSSLRIGLINELGLGSGVPGELSQLSASGNVVLGPESSLDVTELKGLIILKPLREMLLSELSRRNQNLALLLQLQRDTLVRWFPDEVNVTSGSARIDSKWKSSGETADAEASSFFKGEWELLRHSSLADLKTVIGDFGQTEVQLWHVTEPESAGGAAPQGGIRLSSAQAGEISLDFKLSVTREGNRFRLEPRFGISDAEVTRLANLWSAKFAQKLGIPVQSEILKKVPSSDEVKSIEKMGKSWIKGFVEREQSSDPARRDAAKEQMRASEKELKEAVRKLLKQ